MTQSLYGYLELAAFRFGGLWFLVIGLVNLRPGWLLMRKSSYLVHHGQLTTGYSKGGRIVRFKIDTGKSIDFYSPFAPHIIDMPIPILYDLSNPYRAYLAPSSRHFQPITQFTAGFSFTLFGLSALLGLDVAIGVLLFVGIAIGGGIIISCHKRYCRKVIKRRFGNTQIRSNIPHTRKKPKSNKKSENPS